MQPRQVWKVPNLHRCVGPENDLDSGRNAQEASFSTAARRVTVCGVIDVVIDLVAQLQRLLCMSAVAPRRTQQSLVAVLSSLLLSVFPKCPGEAGVCSADLSDESSNLFRFLVFDFVFEQFQFFAQNS